MDPNPTISTQQYHIYVIFIDDYSRFTLKFPLHRKSDFFECFVKFHNLVEKQFNYRLKIFQSDGGGEFISLTFKNY